MDVQTFRTLASRKKAKPKYEESQIQCELVAAARAKYPMLKKLLFSIPNGAKMGGKRTKSGYPIQAGIMVREGLTKGVADLFLSIPIYGCPGVYLETKKPDGRQSDDQKEFEAAVTQMGYAYHIFDTVADGMKIIDEHIQAFNDLKFKK
jgi:hypothetical protein